MKSCKFKSCRAIPASPANKADESYSEEGFELTDYHRSFSSYCSKDDARESMAFTLSNPEIMEIALLAQCQRRLPNLLPAQIVNSLGASVKTLVLDLDETLIHSSYFPMPAHAFKVNIEAGNSNHEIFVAKRPHLDKFLSVCARMFEIVGFTASNQTYADLVFDALDPSKTLFMHRLYRGECIRYKDFYIKDLRRLGRSLRKTVILDNCDVSAALQPKNILKIEPWYTDARDRKLVNALKVLKELARTNNVQVFLTHRWQV